MYRGAPQTKIDGVRSLGGEVRSSAPGPGGTTLSARTGRMGRNLPDQPVTDQAVLNGNGSIGMEIAEDLPDVDVVPTLLWRRRRDHRGRQRGQVPFLHGRAF
ncbi:PALP domain-containing protein [Sinorhizobium medicae]|uniref:hypothetical protein n=1 Tax=Sinorhizobium medicae TaxID=110321 RepID=UPI0030931626|nr:hypothetical protein U8C38_28000 [Sinorhizobium medicae]